MRVVLLDDYEHAALERANWSSLGPEVTVDALHERLETVDELLAALKDCEVVVAMRERTRLSDEVISQLPHLKLIVTSGMGNAAIDLDAARRRGIPVCGTAGPRTSTAELTWALIFALSRHLLESDASLRQGRWAPRLGTELNGKTLGVVGLGRVGSKVTGVALALGMTVLAWSRHLTPEVAQRQGAVAVTKEELLSSSDVVTLHVQLTESSRRLVGRDELALMKPTAILVNTSRGELIDDDALVEALRVGRIAGAGLDTFAVEPLEPGNPYLALKNTILTPHLGYVSDRTYDVFYSQALEDVEGWLAGEPVRVLNPPAGTS